MNGCVWQEYQGRPIPGKAAFLQMVDLASGLPCGLPKPSLNCIHSTSPTQIFSLVIRLSLQSASCPSLVGLPPLLFLTSIFPNKILTCLVLSLVPSSAQRIWVNLPHLPGSLVLFSLFHWCLFISLKSKCRCALRLSPWTSLFHWRFFAWRSWWILGL